MKPFTPWPERIVRQNTCLNTVPCAVLVPVIHKDGEEHLVFEVRSSKLDWQPGEICFPGGRIDKTDASPLAAACGKRGKNWVSVPTTSTSGGLWTTWNRLSA